MKAYLPGNEFWLTDIFEHAGNLFYTPKEQRFLLQVQNDAAGQRLQYRSAHKFGHKENFHEI